MSAFPDYEKYDALALAELVKKGEVSPQELLLEAKNRLSKVNPIHNAVIYQSNALAKNLIKKLDKTSLFCGVPFLVKDLKLSFKGVPMSNGSIAMRDYIPTNNSEMVDKINSAGFITFGKTTTSEWGASSLVNTTAFGATLNPWDLTKNSGGSSGGSSVVVATRVVPMAYSTDGGGSIRLPASYCGIFGFKPSKGLNQYEDISKPWGGAVVSHVSSISVRDSAAYLDFFAGNKGNAYSVSKPRKNSYLFSTTQSEKKLTIGLITEAPTKTKVHPECINAANIAAKYCEALGHDVDRQNGISMAEN
ncbi:MAG: amidase [Methylococcaceae bacterium]|nr:amidase [Methylococcaceae bacterium]